MEFLMRRCDLGRKRLCARLPSVGVLSWLLVTCLTVYAPAKAEITFDLPDYTDQVTESLAGLEATAREVSPVAVIPATLEIDLASAADAQSETLSTWEDQARLSFGEQVRSIKTELRVAFGYMTAINLLKIAKRGGISAPSFKDEGLFEKDTSNLGMDKLVHAHNSYMLAELLAARIRRNTGTTRGTALSGALLSSGFMLYSEIYDGFKGGFGVHDLAFNSMGAGFSVLRETTPGLEEKLDFRFLLMPNRKVYSPTGAEHYRQLRYLFAVKLAGFEQLEQGPLRFVELHGGYYGKGYTRREKERGEPLERELFAGVGLNLSQALFGRTSRSRSTRAASQLLDYWQPPYTYIHVE
jgi:hypothetical protein